MAKILENMIKQGNPEKIAVVIAEAKNIIREAIILDEYTRNPRTKETDKSKLAARAKTQPKAGAKVNAQMKAGVKTKAQPKQNPVLPH